MSQPREEGWPVEMPLRALLISVVLVATSVQGVASSVMEYTDRTAWTSASENIGVITFIGANGDYSTPDGLTLNGVKFTGRHDVGFCQIGYCFAGPPWDLRVGPSSAFDGSSALLGPQDGYSSYPPYSTETALNGRVDIYLPAGVTSLAADFAFSAIGGSDGRSQLYLYAANGNLISQSFWLSTGFYGFTSDVPIAHVILARELSYSGYFDSLPVLDNFGFGQAARPSANPEPAGIALSLLGFAFLAGARQLPFLRARQFRKPAIC
jgi:hypothetical protein